MGHRLVRWAMGLTDLTPKTQLVLVGMAQTAHDQTGRFFKHYAQFLDDDVPSVNSHSALNNHFALLASHGYIGRIRKGSGRHSGRHSQTEYQLIATGSDKRGEPLLPDKALDEWLKIERKRNSKERGVQGRLRLFVSMKGGGARQSTDQPDMPHHMPVAVGQDVSFKSEPDWPKENEDVRFSGPTIFEDVRLSGHPDQPPLKEDKQTDHERETVAATAESERNFFEQIADACKGIGIHGIAPASFNCLSNNLKQSGSRLVIEDAKWIADEFRAATERNGKIAPALLIHITRQRMDNGGRVWFDPNPERRSWGTHDVVAANGIGASGLREINF